MSLQGTQTSYKKINCCICNNLSNTNHYKVIDGFNLNKCKLCDLIFLESVKIDSKQFINDSKEDNEIEYWSFPNLYKKYREIFDGFFQQRWERVCLFNKNVKTHLDIGVGYGFWANFLNFKNVSTFGIEPSVEAANYAIENFQLKVEKKCVEEFESDKKFDLISMFDVLEHLESPIEALSSIKEKLNDDGILYIQVPNVIGLRFPYGHGLGLPHHIWQFNPKSLIRLLEKSDFEVLSYWTGIQGVIGEYEKGGPSLMLKLKWKIANKLKIGNRVQVIAKKKL